MTSLRWENCPTYFFPRSELSQQYLQQASEHPTNGDTYDLIIAHKKTAGAVTIYSSPNHEHLNGLLKTNFSDARAIIVHPKDPYKVWIFPSHILVEVDSIDVANSRSPKLLYETGLPVRSHIPKMDCRLDLLVPSELTTACSYKESLTHVLCRQR
ncbi:hypothetical protein C8J57DRAFT_1515801 [Mycena rebaudengoi]|nr:hypothetical protein C8J57DRAFT_1515801 [Mycena rebaudengoi]